VGSHAGGVWECMCLCVMRLCSRLCVCVRERERVKGQFRACRGTTQAPWATRRTHRLRRGQDAKGQLHQTGKRLRTPTRTL
jgi:hypothetical protein